ncbi:MAG: hypothetical protein P1U61_02740 [Legionellaceae bacterium]|nr:hypothetical protein [Legionellaceae bacterium]
MRTHNELIRAYTDANEALYLSLSDASDSAEHITPIAPATQEERASFNEVELSRLETYQNTHNNLISMQSDASLKAEAKAIAQIHHNLIKMSHWFKQLGGHAFLGRSQKGYGHAQGAVVSLDVGIMDAWHVFYASDRTEKDVRQFTHRVNGLLEDHKKVIHANHDTSQELYYQFELALKGFFEGLTHLVNIIGKKTGLSKGDIPEVSTWIKPEPTTKTLFSDSMAKLGGFFATQPAPRKPNEASGNDDASKKEGDDPKVGM